MFLFSWSITSQLPSEDYPTRWHYSPPLVSRNGPRGGHCDQVSSCPSLSARTINYLTIINHSSSIQRAWSYLDWIYQPDAWPATSVGVPFFVCYCPLKFNNKYLIRHSWFISLELYFWVDLWEYDIPNLVFTFYLTTHSALQPYTSYSLGQHFLTPYTPGTHDGYSSIRML